MTITWLQLAVLRAASLLAPSDQRSEWLAGWRSELWYIPRHQAALFCLGAFQDAFWLRRNNAAPVGRTAIRLDTPLRCLGFLAALAVGGLLVAACLSVPLTQRTNHWHFTSTDLPAACSMALLFSSLLAPAALLVARPAAIRQPMPWRARLRWVIFLALKIALVQPVLLCGLFVWVLIAPVAPFAPLAIIGAWIFALRWVITDQRLRCPVCLRLLSNPVRIGSPAETFLDWYGAESMCTNGHGLLHVPETSASYSGKPQWLRLDSSWKGLFSGAAGIRR